MLVACSTLTKNLWQCKWQDITNAHTRWIMPKLSLLMVLGAWTRKKKLKCRDSISCNLPVLQYHLTHNDESYTAGNWEMSFAAVYTNHCDRPNGRLDLTDVHWTHASDRHNTRQWGVYRGWARLLMTPRKLMVDRRRCWYRENIVEPTHRNMVDYMCTSSATVLVYLVVKLCLR